ncbi:MAG TPA: sigma-70 family RNA polymerase sigma factor [Terrimicrobiaceae bacterium]
MNFPSGGAAPSRENDPEPSRGLEEAEGDEHDVALMLRVKAGDLQAFEALVTRHQHRVVGTAAKMLGSATEAEDIGQQVFVRVWKSAARYQPSAKFTTWLMTITRHLVFNEMRRRRRTHLVAMEADQDDPTHHQFADAEAPAPSEKLLDAELQRAIDAAIENLPENQRLAIVLRRYEEMPYEEIAKVLRTSVPAVKSILFRARSELRERLKRYLE